MQQEKEPETMSDKDKIKTEFAVFCIENTAAELGVLGKEVYDALKETDGISVFLYPSYDVLHTQGRQYIVEETLAYLKKHNPRFMQSKGVTA